MAEVKVFNNINERVYDDLKVVIKDQSKLQVIASCFSLYGYAALKEELSKISELKFIFSSPTFISTASPDDKLKENYVPRLSRQKAIAGTDFEIKLRNKLVQKAIAKECANWVRQKVKFKSLNSYQLTIPPMLGIKERDDYITYAPVADFSTSSFGIEKSSVINTNILKVSSPVSDGFLRSFEDTWQDNKRLDDVTDEVLSHLEKVYRDNSAEYVYALTLNNIFKDFIEENCEEDLARTTSGFKDSEVWNKLYNFQKDAALAIISKLNKYNGCILADSVGLGKTFTALSVIKYFENRNYRVLVLCPKKLADNWNVYKGNYTNNPLAKDRLRYDVLFHSDLSRTSGMSNGLDLSTLKFDNYDLIVIDESHAFRNGGKTSIDKNEEDRDNRYNVLLKKCIKQGVHTKVLMLSATPVNNRFVDLKNQLMLAYEGDSTSLEDKLSFDTSIDDIFRAAQKNYNEWSKKKDHKDTQSLINALPFDFFKILDTVTIARSRKHIQKFYNTSNIGKFPTRLSPLSVYPTLTNLDENLSFKDIATELNKLYLSLYVPSNFIKPSARCKYEDKANRKGLSGLSIQGREFGIRKLMSINLLKRLESSVHSFDMTLCKIIGSIEENLEKIEEYRQKMQDKIGIEGYVIDDFIDTNADDDIDENSLDSDDEEAFVVQGKKTPIPFRDLNLDEWQAHLKYDEKILNQIHDKVKKITSDHDDKLQELIKEINLKRSNPINTDNKKILIFTAFSDTAEYLYEALSPIFKADGVNVGLVTGNGVSTTIKSKSSLDFNKVLTLFSPISKEKDKILPDLNETIDILIATDCISEGQNLQDCDYLINYDIHWNPVRIIQRFGRIDRIGSKNDKIQLVNFWPTKDLDDYINLKSRVENRMKATNITSSGDSDLLSSEEDDLEYRRKQLERLRKEVVDIEDLDSNINIMDLGLNEFRMDLVDFRKKYKSLDTDPLGVESLVKDNDLMPKGSIFVLKQVNEELNTGKHNHLYPYYLIYVKENGDIFVDHLSPKKTLDLMRMACKAKDDVDTSLYQSFNKETSNGYKMDKYCSLLQSAIDSMIEKKDESDIESFFSGGVSNFSHEEIKGLDDFELICFLVVR